MKDITLQQIEIFLTVAEQLNLSEAARDLFLNQSAVSRWMQRLENSLNTKLFYRTNRGVELTDNGEYLYAELKPMYEKFSDTIKTMQRVYDMKENILRIGCLDSSEVIDALKDTLRRYETFFPDTLLKIDYFNYEDLREELVCGSLDCIVSYALGFGEYWNVHEKPFRHLNTYIAVPAHSALADSASMPTDKLGNETLLLLYISDMKDAEIRAIETCRKIGFTPKAIKYMPSFFSLEMAVRNGQGFSICGANISSRFTSDIKLYHVKEPYKEQYVLIAWRKNGCSPLAREFVDSIRDCRDEHREDKIPYQIALEPSAM